MPPQHLSTGLILTIKWKSDEACNAARIRALQQLAAKQYDNYLPGADDEIPDTLNYFVIRQATRSISVANYFRGTLTAFAWEAIRAVLIDVEGLEWWVRGASEQDLL